MTDDEIIHEVAEIERADEKRRCERRAQRHHIVSTIGRVLMFDICVCLVITGIGFGYHAYEASQAKIEQRNAQQVQEKLEEHNLQELAWQRCLDQLGLETCDAIEARLVEHCIYISDEQEMRACFQRKL